MCPVKRLLNRAGSLTQTLFRDISLFSWSHRSIFLTDATTTLSTDMDNLLHRKRRMISYEVALSTITTCSHFLPGVVTYLSPWNDQNIIDNGRCIECMSLWRYKPLALSDDLCSPPLLVGSVLLIVVRLFSFSYVHYKLCSMLFMFSKLLVDLFLLVGPSVFLCFLLCSYSKLVITSILIALFFSFSWKKTRGISRTHIEKLFLRIFQIWFSEL